MTAASKYGSPQKLLRGGKSARRTRFPWGETVVLGEVADKCNRGAWRGMGPSTYTRVAEITSGRAISQQGLVATCKDQVHKGEPEAPGGFWSDAWARMSDDGGVMPSQATFEVVPTRGNTPGGQRSPGHSVATDEGQWRTWPDRRSNLLRQGEGMAGTAGPTSLEAPDAPVLWRGSTQTTKTRGVCEPAF
jgi:hypothetical protein